jgi:hypothetical protein
MDRTKETTMSRSLIPVTLSLFAVALLAVPSAFAKASSRGGVRIQGVCSQQSTSKLKLSRDDRGIEIEFQVDQNRNGVPWKVTLRRNGQRVAALTATTRAPSGSFEIRRVIAGHVRTDRITAIATRAGETCKANSGAAKTNAATTSVVDDNPNAVADDHGHHSGGHS